MTREVWFRCVAFSLLFAIAAGIVWPIPGARDICLVGVAITLFMAIGDGIRKRREHDPYSLSDLRELVLEGSHDETEVGVVPDGADVYCMCCHQTYASKYKVCPYCNKR